MALIGIPVTGVLGWYWSSQLEVQGLALGLSAGSFFQLLLLAWNFRKFENLQQNWWPIHSMIVIIAASAMMACAAWWCARFGNWEEGPFLFWNWLVLAGSIFTGAFLYLLLVMILKEEQSLRLLRWLKNRRYNT